MRRILINAKGEFNYVDIKISNRHQAIRRFGHFLESKNKDKKTVIVSSKPNNKENDLINDTATSE